MTLRPAVVIGLVAFQVLIGVPLGAWCVGTSRAEASSCCCGHGDCPAERNGPGGLEAGCCDLGSSSPRSEPGSPSPNQAVLEGPGWVLPEVPTLLGDPICSCTARRIVQAPDAPAFSPPLYELFSSYLI